MVSTLLWKDIPGVCWSFYFHNHMCQLVPITSQLGIKQKGQIRGEIGHIMAECFNWVRDKLELTDFMVFETGYLE